MNFYDVIVVGGGTSGAFAAIASARMGLNTLLIESNGYLGGTATGALVSPMMGTRYDDYISDLNAEVVSELKKTGDGFGNWFNPEMLKIVLEDIAVKSGVNIRYYTSVIGVEKLGNSIDEVITYSKSGQETFKAKIVIDASGDADVAYFSGVPFEKGNNKGKNQPVSLRFTMTNVDLKKFSNYVRELGQKDELDVNEFHTAHTEDSNFPLRPVFEEAVTGGLLTYEDSKYFQCFSVPGRPKDLSFNCPEIFENIDGTNAEELTKAQIIGKQKINRYVKFLKTLPGLEEAYLQQIAPLVGVRESRRIVGLYKLTARDVLSYKKFSSRVISSNYPVDIHDITKEELDYINSLKQNVNDNEKYYDIPYEIMLTNEIDNLLVTGRCISSDFIAHSTIRVQTLVRAMGEACAYISYLAIKENCKPKEIDNMKFKCLINSKGFK